MFGRRRWETLRISLCRRSRRSAWHAGEEEGACRTQADLAGKRLLTEGGPDRAICDTRCYRAARMADVRLAEAWLLWLLLFAVASLTGLSPNKPPEVCVRKEVSCLCVRKVNVRLDIVCMRAAPILATVQVIWTLCAPHRHRKHRRLCIRLQRQKGS